MTHEIRYILKCKYTKEQQNHIRSIRNGMVFTDFHKLNTSTRARAFAMPQTATNGRDGHGQKVAIIIVDAKAIWFCLTISLSYMHIGDL